LGQVWSNESVRTRLGCLTGEQAGIQGEELYFERGHMLWRPDTGFIYVLFDSPWQPEGWGAFTDTDDPTEADTAPTVVGPTPQSGAPVHMQPKGRFGKLWRENPWLQEKMGLALVPYDDGGKAMPILRFNGAVQDFEHGTLLWNGAVCFVLRTDDMSWDMY
jgi:hypothetical protein